MVKKLFFSVQNKVYKVSVKDAPYSLTKTEVEGQVRALAVDRQKEGRIYAGTFDDGLFISDDFGDTWQHVAEGIQYNRISSIAVSETEVKNDYGVVWVGTEPSSLFRSEDGGKTWTERTSLIDLPSEVTWSFPPRPHTHHVKSIQPDIHDENRIFVGIELGGVMKSEDKGNKWEDRKPNSQYDCHTLTMCPLAKNRVYEAAGGGFAETTDGGNTWQTLNKGLSPYTYLVSIAVDSGNPDVIIASAAKNARTAYIPERAHSVIVRKEGNGDWEIIEDGLPNRDHSSVCLLLSDPYKRHSFFAVNNTGIYESRDAGVSWQRLNIDWPESIKTERILSFAFV